MSELKTTITKDGQRYVDDPVYVMPKRDETTPIAHAVSAAFNGGQSALLRARPPLVVRHERVLLRWMKPDGRGGLVPREGGGR